LWTFCLGLAWNLDPLDLCLLSSYDYKHESHGHLATSADLKVTGPGCVEEERLLIPTVPTFLISCSPPQLLQDTYTLCFKAKAPTGLCSALKPTRPAGHSLGSAAFPVWPLPSDSLP
jgi:hypothetical protein